MHRFIAIFLFAISTCLSLRASIPDDRVKLPDFAYPQDVIKTATELIKSRSADERVLGALEYTAANVLIDQMSLGSSMKYLISLSDEDKDPAVRALLKLIAARIGDMIYWDDTAKNEYFENQGTFEEQSKKLLSLVFSLLKEAIATAPPVPLTEFKNVMDWNEIGLSIIPTVRDFVAWHALYIYPNLKEEALNLTSPESPTFYAIQATYFLNSSPLQTQFSTILDNLKNPNAAYELYHYINEQSVYSLARNNTTLEEIEFLEKAKPLVSGQWVEETVDNRLKLLKAPYFQIKYQKEIKYPDRLKLEVTGYNLDSLTIYFYKFPSTVEADKYKKDNHLNDLKPLLAHTLKFDNIVEGDVVSEDISLETGHYLLYVPGDTASLLPSAKCLLSVYPMQIAYFASNSQNDDVLQAIDVNTGAPLIGLEGVICSDNNNILFLNSFTNENGCIGLPRRQGRYQAGFRDSKTGNIFLYGSSIRNGKDVVSEDDAVSYDIDVTTDLNIYRPGQKVNFVLTAANGDQTIDGLTTDIKVILPNPKDNNSGREKSDTISINVGPTDLYGRATGEITVPEDCALGLATFKLTDQSKSVGRFRIADFKLNDLKITGIKSIYTNDSIIITGYTTNQANIGIGQTSVTLNYEYNLSYYENNIEDENYSLTTETSGNGEFRFSIPRYYGGNIRKWCLDLEDIDKDEEIDEHEFMVHCKLEAKSQNGRNAVSSLSLDMQYPDRLKITTKRLYDRNEGLNFSVEIQGSVPVESVKWQLIEYDYDNESKVISGKAKPGEITISSSLLKKVRNGKYRLAVKPSKAGIAMEDYATIYLYDLASKEVTFNSLLIVEEGIQTGNQGEIAVGIANDSTYLWMEYPIADKQGGNTIVISKHLLNRGWHKLSYDIPALPRGLSSVDINLYTVDRKGNILAEEVEVKPRAKDTLSLNLESFRDNLIPGSREKWTFVTKKNGVGVKAALFLNMMNSKLLRFGTPDLPSVLKEKGNYLFNFHTYHLRFMTGYSETLRPGVKWYKIVPKVQLPSWRELIPNISDISEDLYFSNDPQYIVYGLSSYTTAYGAMLDQVVLLEDKTGTVKTTNYDFSSVEVREPKVYTALWEPMLTTGKDGRVDVSFTVPGETTGWELFAEAWTTDLLSARLTHSFTAVKPLVVAPNPPRFVRVGDSVNLVSAITNATDSVMDVSVRVTVEGDSVTLADAQSEFTLAAGETRFVNTPVSVDVTGGQLVYTVRASNGVTGDGERNAIPVLASTALVTESRNFYLNPGQAEFSMSLPSPEGTDFSSELHFTANPMWSVVEALPKAIEPWCKAASALAMSIYTSNTALDLNRRFPQAKDVIDISNARKVAQQSLAGLRELQTNDGGFKWGVWADGPDRHSTLAVLDWLASEKERPEIAALINPALEYVDKTAVGKDGKVDTDFLYTVVRSFYGMPADQNGSRVVNATVTDMLRNWKKYSIDQKALTVIALKNYGYDKVAATILGSLSQFGRMTDDRGFEFPNMPTILAYTHTLEAFASADPNSDIARRIVQYLLYIRQGMEWGSSAFTSYAVRSIMTAASSWVTKASPVAVSVDGVTVPTDADGLAGVINTSVSGRRVKVSRTEPSTPAYGAVVSRFVAPLSDIAPFSDGEVTVTKTIVRVRPDGSQEVLGQNVSVTPGERLTVILKVTAKRPLSNLVVTDNRPAAFEPVVQVPRMVWNRTGSPFYLENRDATTNIYISYMASGAAEYSYEVTVNNTGAFTTGLATVTSVIAPEITAHSGSTPFSLSNAK